MRKGRGVMDHVLHCIYQAGASWTSARCYRYRDAQLHLLPVLAIHVRTSSSRHPDLSLTAERRTQEKQRHNQPATLMTNFPLVRPVFNLSNALPTSSIPTTCSITGFTFPSFIHPAIRS